MALLPADRQAFSLNIVTAAANIAGVQKAQSQLQSQITKIQQLDSANKNLLDPVNLLTTGYVNEYSFIDGNQRTTFVEQNILDAANRKLNNYFFPNNISVSVPSLSAEHNVWTQTVPYALNYAIAKNYSEGYGTYANNEDALIALILSYTPYVVSPPSGTPVVTVKATVTTYLATLSSEAAVIAAIADPNSTNNAQNSAAHNDIVSNIVPALNTYNASSGSSSDLTALKTACSARSTFLTTRTSQLNTILGAITQDVTTGTITASSGLFGKRYGILSLRINLLSGSLTQIASLQQALNAQTTIISNIESTKATYQSLVPTSLFKSAANGTSTISILDTSFLSPGDTVYIFAEGQQELQRAVKSISGDVVTLNDVVPSKYRPAESARIYKDIT